MSHDPLSRATFFLNKAEACLSDERVEFEAYLEAAIVSARAALHRFHAKHRKHPECRNWWDGLLANPPIDFIRTERDWLLKEAPPKINQIVFAATISVGGDHASAYSPARAGEFYYFEDPGVSATSTVAKHLGVVSDLLSEGERLFM